MEGDIFGKTFLLLKTCQDKKLHNDLTKPCEMCKEGIRCERMDNYKRHSICVQRSLLLLLLENQHLIVSLVINHSRKYISYSCYSFVYLLDCSRIFVL